MPSNHLILCCPLLFLPSIFPSIRVFSNGSALLIRWPTSHHFMANRWGNSGNSVRFYFLGFQNHCRWWLQPWNKKTLAPWKESYNQPRQHIKKQGHYFANKGPPSQGYGFSSSHVRMWELDYKESWALKNWCFWTVVLQKTLESPLNCKNIQPVHPKGNQYWIFIGRTDVEAETPKTLATWCEELTHLKRPWCWERLKVVGEGVDRGWDVWMASRLNGHEFG